MIIEVNFYKPSGKWYSWGDVNIGDARLWKGDVYAAILKNQNILEEGVADHYFIVTSNARPGPEDDPSQAHGLFCEALFPPTKSLPS